MDMKSCREEDEQALRKVNEEMGKQAAIDMQEMRKRFARRRTGAKFPLGNESEDEDADTPMTLPTIPRKKLSYTNIYIRRPGKTTIDHESS